MFSIIIPTLNEEYHLSLLLESIKNQEGIGEHEIIIADAGSDDKTVEIAKDYGCKVVPGGLPARGRNKGAEIAGGDLLLFLDADTFLPRNSLQKILEEFDRRNLDLAGCLLTPFGENKLLRVLYDVFYNSLAISLEKILPAGCGLILAKKEIHAAIGGFDEAIKLGEDFSYVRKGVRKGRYGLLKSVKICFSQRRFQEEGWLKTYGKYWLGMFYFAFLGDIKTDIFKYRFNSHKKA